jgi:HemY protein
MDVIAGEAGDGDRARRKAQKAHELLDRPALTELVSAKAAEASGATAEAKTHYTALLADPKTEAAGLRGLARMATDAGDHRAAIEMGKTAYEPAKGPAWAYEVLFKAQLGDNDWQGALDSLATAEKRKHVDKEKAKRQRAVLLSALASGLEANGDKDAAIETVLKATDASAGFAPGAALAARLLAQDEQTKKAASLIEKAWARAPHPALSLAYRDIFRAEPQKTLAKKIKHLVKSNPVHRESAILTAEHALSEGDGVAATTALGTLLRGEDPSARLCSLAGAAEDKQGNKNDARAWHHRASNAPLEADWSDLDPDGPSFNYTDHDWRRLVCSYGESGELIHPRYEARKRRRPVVSDIDTDLNAPEDIVETVAPQDEGNSPPPSADDPGVLIDEKEAKSLGSRLNNLLGNSDKT